MIEQIDVLLFVKTTKTLEDKNGYKVYVVLLIGKKFYPKNIWNYYSEKKVHWKDFGLYPYWIKL